jgi:hypothetical protein
MRSTVQLQPQSLNQEIFEDWTLSDSLSHPKHHLRVALCQQLTCLWELSLSRFVDLYLLIDYFYKIRALLQKIGSRVMLPSINSNVLALKIIRKGISQLLECDDCASFMSKYSTRNASRIYIDKTKWSPKCCVVEVRSSHRNVTGS